MSAPQAAPDLHLGLIIGDDFDSLADSQLDNHTRRSSQLNAKVEAELRKEAGCQHLANMTQCRVSSSLAVRVLRLAVQHLVSNDQTSGSPGVSDESMRERLSRILCLT